MAANRGSWAGERRESAANRQTVGKEASYGQRELQEARNYWRIGPGGYGDLFARVIDLTEAETDQDHLDITILNRPQTPDRTAFILGKSDESYLPPLHEAALELEDLGCEVLATPCVTGHYRSDEWSAGLQTAHLVHMPRETARYLALAGKRCVGIMATDGTGHARVLQNELEAYGLKAVLPDAENQAKVMSIIYDDVKRGRPANMRAFDEVSAICVSRV